MTKTGCIRQLSASIKELRSLAAYFSHNPEKAAAINADIIMLETKQENLRASKKLFAQLAASGPKSDGQRVIEILADINKRRT